MCIYVYVYIFIIYTTQYTITMIMMISLPPRDTSPHQDSAGIALSGTPPPAQPPPPPQTRGHTVPQRANPTQTAYAHFRKRAQAQGQHLGTLTIVLRLLRLSPVRLVASSVELRSLVVPIVSPSSDRSQPEPSRDISPPPGRGLLHPPRVSYTTMTSRHTQTIPITRTVLYSIISIYKVHCTLTHCRLLCCVSMAVPLRLVIVVQWVSAVYRRLLSCMAPTSTLYTYFYILLCYCGSVPCAATSPDRAVVFRLPLCWTASAPLRVLVYTQHTMTVYIHREAQHSILVLAQAHKHFIRAQAQDLPY